MRPVKLDSRLAAVASLVKPGNTLIDIGTDHAYLPCHLTAAGVCPSAIAADLRAGPLENAQQTIAACGLGSRVSTLLSDGLDQIAPQTNCTVVLAGMGGLLIVQLLSRAAWLKNQDVQIIAQSMSHAEDVRRFFYASGFSLERELCVQEPRHCYCAIASHYTGETVAASPALPFGGLLFESRDAAAIRYLQTQRARLKKRCLALRAFSGDSPEVLHLQAVLNDFDRLWHPC